MNIQVEKLELMRLILETENPNIISAIKKVLKKEAKKDFWDELPENQKEEILQGIEEIDNNEVVSYEDFIKKHR